MFHGALVRANTNQSLGSGAFPVVVFGNVVYDTDGFWDSGNNQFVIPDGVFLVRLHTSVKFSGASASGRRFVSIGTGAGIKGVTDDFAVPASTPFTCFVSTPALVVSAGDAIPVYAFQNTGGSISILGDNVSTYYAIEVIQTPHGRPDSPTLP